MARRLSALTGPVAILLTPAEVRAIISAAALHQAHYEDEDGDRSTRAVDRALDRVLDKVRHAAQEVVDRG